MYASVIPAIKLPRTFTVFDYIVPQEYEGSITQGSLVTIPWRNRTINGVVIALTQNPSIEEKKMKAILTVEKEGMLTPDLVATILWMSAYYIVAPGTILHSFLPPKPKRKKPSEPKVPSPHLQIHTPALRQILHYNSPQQKYRETLSLIQPCLNRKESAILIAPHAEDISALISLLQSTIGEENIIAFHGTLTKTALWHAWLTASSGKPVVIVGTRMAIAAPTPNLGTIIIHECDSPDLKQYDQNPRFDTRTVALFRAEQKKADLIFMSHAPRTEEYALSTTSGFTITSSSSTQKTVSSVLVDVSGHHKKEEEKLLSPSAIEAISDALQLKKGVLFFHNRRGTAGAAFCTDCSFLFRCESCLIAQKIHGTTLYCHRCEKKTPLPTHCPRCKSISFNMVGTGTTKLTQLLGVLFPEATVVQFDTDVRKERDLVELNKANILVGTQLLLHHISELPDLYNNIGAVVATTIDDLLLSPSFRTTENAWRTVRVLQDIADTNNAPLILQTFDPENQKIRTLLEDSTTFFAHEYAERFKTLYPPATTLLTITTRGTTENEAQTHAIHLLKKLTQQFEKQIWIRGPIRPATPLRHGKWRSVLVIKIKELFPELLLALQSLPEDFIIDRDPEYIG